MICVYPGDAVFFRHPKGQNKDDENRRKAENGKGRGKTDSGVYRTDGKMRGTARERAALAGVLRKYTRGRTKARFARLEISDDAGDETAFSADGPYGEYDCRKEAEVFREMAQAAPQAGFGAVLQGGDDRIRVKHLYRLEKGVLQSEIRIYDLEKGNPAYRQYVLKNRPYAFFTFLFRIAGESFPEARYRDLVRDLVRDSRERETEPFDMEYEPLMDLFRVRGIPASMGQDEYRTVREEMEAYRILPEAAFCEENGFCEKKSRLFDAAGGYYIFAGK
jgi:hypothetical protein